MSVPVHPSVGAQPTGLRATRYGHGLGSGLPNHPSAPPCPSLTTQATCKVSLLNSVSGQTAFVQLLHDRGLCFFTQVNLLRFWSGKAYTGQTQTQESGSPIWDGGRVVVHVINDKVMLPVCLICNLSCHVIWHETLFSVSRWTLQLSKKPTKFDSFASLVTLAEELLCVCMCVCGGGAELARGRHHMRE